jgi:hypothetical protein
VAAAGAAADDTERQLWRVEIDQRERYVRDACVRVRVQVSALAPLSVALEPFHGAWELKRHEVSMWAASSLSQCQH